MGMAQGKGEDCARDAPTSPQTTSPREKAHPITCTLRLRAEAKGWRWAEPEKSRSPVTTGAGQWHPAIPAWRQREDDFGRADPTASR